MNHATLKRVAKESHCSVRDLIVLAPQNDPFYAGTETDRLMAEWFRDLWERFGYGLGVHLRRIHYQLVSQENPTKHDGTPYENTKNNWTYLCNAGKMARYLGLISSDSFIDRRNPDPHIHAQYAELRERKEWEISWYEWDLPRIPDSISTPLPTVEVSGYDYDLSDQPYHLEVWVEKSTMNEELSPVCREHGVNLVTGLGEMSITSVLDLVQRVQSAGKPARIFYVSDYDPAGYGMPISVARKIEFMLYDNGSSEDIRLTPIVLTREQVQHYQLPRTPIKDSELRKGRFEQIHGEGAVELDALEALHPGELARLIEEAVIPYRDLELEEQLSELRDEMQDQAENLLSEILEPYREEREEIEEQVKEIIARYEGMNDELAPYRWRLDNLLSRIQADTNAIDIELDDRVEASVDGDGPEEWLYDSSRDYLDQLRVYKEHQNEE